MGQFDVTAILLARGGSKGIKRKNLQIIGGGTLVRKTIKNACHSDIFSQIILSSDDDEILREAEGLNVQTHKRSCYASTDIATSEKALFEVLSDFGTVSGFCFLLQCTTPFISTCDLKKMHLLVQNHPDSTVVSGYLQSIHHWFYRDNITPLEPIDDVVLRRGPRQRGESVFIENGGAYVFPVEKKKKKGSRFMSKVMPYVMEKYQSIDIDTKIDLNIARFLHSQNL